MIIKTFILDFKKKVNKKGVRNRPLHGVKVSPFAHYMQAKLEPSSVSPG